MKALLPLLLLAGCDGIPKDPDHTLDRIRAEGVFRVGVIAPHEGPAAATAGDFLRGVAAGARATPSIELGATEPLLKKLEGGELDLVIGPVDAKSPWKTMVSFLPPLAEQKTPHGPLQLNAIAPNGENEWITLLDREARRVGPQ